MPLRHRHQSCSLMLGQYSRLGCRCRGEESSEADWRLTGKRKRFRIMLACNITIRDLASMRERNQNIAEAMSLVQRDTCVSASRGEARFWLKLYLAGWLGMIIGSWPACGQGQSVASVDPAPGGIVSNLTSVTVTFTQPVIGVHAEDLILNGSSGTNLAGSGAVYTFNFCPLAAGVVEASWNGAHSITDLSANRLNDLGANTLWEYSLIDTVPPTVSAIN